MEYSGSSGVPVFFDLRRSPDRGRKTPIALAKRVSAYYESVASGKGSEKEYNALEPRIKQFETVQVRHEIPEKVNLGVPLKREER